MSTTPKKPTLNLQMVSPAEIALELAGAPKPDPSRIVELPMLTAAQRGGSAVKAGASAVGDPMSIGQFTLEKMNPNHPPIPRQRVKLDMTGITVPPPTPTPASPPAGACTRDVPPTADPMKEILDMTDESTLSTVMAKLAKVDPAKAVRVVAAQAPIFPPSRWDSDFRARVIAATAGALRDDVWVENLLLQVINPTGRCEVGRACRAVVFFSVISAIIESPEDLLDDGDDQPEADVDPLADMVTVDGESSEDDLDG